MVVSVRVIVEGRRKKVMEAVTLPIIYMMKAKVVKMRVKLFLWFRMPV